MIHTPKFPLKIGDRSLFEKQGEIKRIILFHLTNLLLTSPGERISDPDYGVGIRQFLFENITTGLLNNIADRIEAAIQRYLDYIDVLAVEVSSPPDSHELKVKVKFEIPDLDILETLEIGVSDI